MGERAQALAADLSRDAADPRDVLAALHVFRRVGVDADGVLSIEADAELPERDGEVPWSEPTATVPAFGTDERVGALLAVSERLSPVEWIEVEVAVHRSAWNPRLSVPTELALAMVEGRILTADDARAVRAEVLAERAAAGLDAVAPVLDVVEAWGGEVVSVSALAGVVRMWIPEAALVDLRHTDGVTTLALAGEESPDAGAGYYYDVYGDTLTGLELSDLIQATQFYDRGYFGEGQRVALLEGGGNDVFVDHPGFLDDLGNYRFENCVESGGSCTPSFPTSGAAHATAVASVLLGDITRGQDPGITGGLDQAERSGVARRAEGVGFASTSAAEAVLATGAFDDVFLLTRSEKVIGDDPGCAGNTAAGQVANALYESGVAYLKSAGNQGHGSATNCMVTSPGAAIGVLSVAAWQAGDDGQAPVDSGEEYQYPGSSRGGTSTWGRGRTIIGVTASSLYEYPYAYEDPLVNWASVQYIYGTDWVDPPDLPGNGPQTFCCTSSATPAASGAALLFREWYHDLIGADIDDPGLLYANLLLMGDRTVQNGTDDDDGTRTTGAFDNLWGAGKLRLRMFDDTGLDGPALWGDGTVCVDDGAGVTVSMSSAAHPTVGVGADVLRVVAWWYEDEHDARSTGPSSA